MRQLKSWLLPLACAGGSILAICYVCHSLGSWYIDDSAISLAYARNLTRGIGLVAQPGSQPVEGFSNPLWVFLEAFVMKLFQWQSLAIPRVLSCVLFAGLICHIFLRYWNDIRKLFVWQFALLLTILQPAVSIWSMSGLENGLVVVLIFELLMQLMDDDFGNPWIISVLVAAIALTRPESILFAASYPLCVLLRTRNYDYYLVKKLVKSLLFVFICYGGYLIFRVIYFGDILPNTYYAKALPTIVSIRELVFLGAEMRTRIFSALFMLFGQATAWIILGICVCVWTRRALIVPWVKSHLPIFIVFFIAIFTYAYLPNDWMPFCRFATAAFVSCYVMLAHMCVTQVSGVMKFVCVCVLLACSTANCIKGTCQFVENIPIAVSHVQERGEYFHRWGEYLGIKHPLLMIADAGGILWDEKLGLVDLGMLCDATIAHCIGEQTMTPDCKRFLDYVFEDRKPDFIATRAYHSYISNLCSDNRFCRDYVPIYQYLDVWILNRYNCIMYSGDYVRRSRIIGHEVAFKKMQGECATIYYPFDMRLGTLEGE